MRISAAINNMSTKLTFGDFRASSILRFLAFTTILSMALSCKYSKISPQHTMCKPASKTCIYKHKGLYAQEKAHILHLHNDLRRKVANGTEKRMNQPPATNMALLRWDEELAMSAQKHSEYCKFQHDCQKCREVDRWPVGQNIYMRSSNRENDKTTWDTAIFAWYDEVGIPGFPARTVDDFNVIPGTLHYSQIVWAETDRIGCGFTHFKDRRFYRKLYVCNYGGGGNILGDPVYDKGTPCSKCPAGTRCSNQYPGLCE